MDEFDDAVESSPSSRKFKEQYARFAPSRDDHYFVHRGPLTLSGSFTAPGFCTLIIGDLTVEGLVDLDNPEEFDEGGLFIVIGNVSCRAFSGHYGKCAFVDGNLVASELILNAYEDSSLVVTGDLRTKLFYGEDIWAEVGGVAEMEYGEGCCLPIGYQDARQMIRPQRNTESHLVLDPDVLNDRNSLKLEEALTRLRRGKSILRSKRNIGRALKPKLSKLGKKRVAMLMARAEAGETITEIDLSKCELRFVPEEIQKFRQLRKLCLSGNEVKVLPEWIGEFTALEVLEAEGCGLTMIPPSVASLPMLRQLIVDRNDIIELSFDQNAYPVLEHLRVGGGRRAHDFVARIDFARFPNLRCAEQIYSSSSPEIDFGVDCDFWNARHLVYLEFDAIYKTQMPAGLAKATGLKGLKCRLTPQSLRSAFDLLPSLASLEVLTISGWDLKREDLLALADAFPEVYVSVAHCSEFGLDTGSPMYSLCSSISNHLHFGRYNEAIGAAEQFFTGIDFTKPQFEKRFQERALQSWLVAMKFAAAEERDPDGRRNKFIKAAQLADRILPVLPDNGESCVFAGVGWLRWYSLLAQANRCIYQENPDLAQAKALFNLVHSETGDTNDVSKERVRTALRGAEMNV
jgi:Leucine-rich repeat (LRR) protein